MKKNMIVFIASLFCLQPAMAQYFKGSWERDVTNVVNLKIAFKMKPTANITTQVSYMEAAFRFPTATTATFTIDNISSNTSLFPGLSFQRFTPNYAANGFTYYKFVFNTAIVPSASYLSSTEYTLFTITTSLPASAMPEFDMVSNLVLGQYQFGAVDGSGVLISAGSGEQLYGAGYVQNGNEHILPLFSTPLPVKFRNFTAEKKGNDALLNWHVENQDASTSHYEVERSIGGNDFYKIETVIANAGNSKYGMTDANITLLQVPVIYYRIKQVDKDGRYVYSNTRSLKMESKAESSVYPNPAIDHSILSFYLGNSHKVNVNVIDSKGRTVQSFVIDGKQGLNQHDLIIDKLPPGMYNVVINANNQVEIIRLIKGN